MRGSRLSARTNGARRRRAEPRIHAVVLSGGAGERFWPRSRRRFPKPLLPVVDGVSLLSATLARARRFAPRDRTWLICGREHATAMRRAAGLPPGNLFVEPLRRNTAMAVGVAATLVARRDPDAVLVVLPADHRIPDAGAFAAAVRRAARAAADAQVLVTLGVRPTRPDVGYGYIELGDAIPTQMGLHHVKRFAEKPGIARARRFQRSGRFLWNAGVFVWTARAILEEIEACAPKVHAALAKLTGKGGRKPGPAAVRAAYQAAPSIAVDVAVLERSRRVWTLPVSFRWSDVGTWASLAEELGVTAGANRRVNEREGELVLEEASGNLVWGTPGRTVALLGVEGLAVIDTPDALLVAPLSRSPEVRRIVERLRKAGREDLL